ncbi:MAG: hypothetical protein AAFX59_09020 [Pseudomonadota bacterium]
MWPDGTDVILSDTVGFISDLPTQLVAAFRATLEEVLAADIVLHVRDIAHPESEEQAQDVRAILGDLGLDEDVPLLEIWNKIDAVTDDARAPLKNRAMRDDGVLIVSALTGEGLEAFTDTVAERLGGVKRQDVVDLPFSAGRARAWLFDQGVVEAEEQLEQGLRFRVTWTDRQKARFAEIGA